MATKGPASPAFTVDVYITATDKNGKSTYVSLAEAKALMKKGWVQDDSVIIGDVSMWKRHDQVKIDLYHPRHKYVVNR